MPACQCDADVMAQISLPTESFVLCHHSPPQELARAKARYEDLISRLAAGLDPYVMVQEDLSTASDYYARQRLTPQQRAMMNEYEQNIVQAAFLRVRTVMTNYLLLEKLHQVSMVNTPGSRETSPPDENAPQEDPQ